MKLLYITNGINGAGGLERVLSIKASYLADNYGYQVTILSLDGTHSNPFYDFSSKVNMLSIKVAGNPLKYIITYKNGIKKVVSELQPDVISVCDDGLKGLLFPIIFGRKIPVIYERHASVQLNFETEKNEFWFTELKNKLLHRIMLFGANKFTKFIILTNGNKKDWPGVSCTVIPNPTSFMPMEGGDFLTKNTILAIGSHCYNKGFDRLIKIWSILVNKFPDWHLEIFGKQNSSFNLQRMIDEYGLSSSIHVKKPILNIQKEYENASIFVLPSRSEGFGMVLIEAMSFGVPCVAFDCPHGPADIINNKENGFLVENGNIECFANRLKELMENEELRIQFGAQAREDSKKYSPELIIPQWDKLFKSILA